MAKRKPLKTKIKIEIVGANKIIKDTDIELEIKKTNEKEPNYCTVTIYNMADTTYNEINDKALYVRCYVDIGAKGYSLIFEGDLRNLKKDKKPRKAKSKYTKTGKLRKVRKSTVAPKYSLPKPESEWLVWT